jgi:hypothetical protein
VKILTEKKTEYGNWVSPKLITIPGVLVLLSLALSLLLPALIPVAAFFFLALVYFAYARYRFSRQGGDVQATPEPLSCLGWKGADHPKIWHPRTF